MTTAPLFLLPALPAGQPPFELVLAGPEGHHAARVRRLRPGEPLTVGDGAGGLLHGAVTAVAGDRVTVAVHTRQDVPDPAPRLVVVQALPKSDRLESCLELLTELGADEVVPWPAARCVGQWRAERSAAKWRRTVAEAAKQSRRAWVPAVSAPLPTAAVADRLAAASAALVLHESAPGGLPTLQPAGDVVVVVGPEGGIAAEELDRFQAAGATLVRLGAPVLRTSTAGAAALAALSVVLGRWT